MSEAPRCPHAPICMWAAVLGSDNERTIRADQRRLDIREMAAAARDLEWSARKLLELAEKNHPDTKQVQQRIADLRRIAARVVRALEDASERNAA